MSQWLSESCSRQRYLLALIFIVLTAVVLSRLYIVGVSPRFDQADDLGIYREVGKLVLAGIDPYDFKSHLAEREAQRLDNVGMVGWSAASKNTYNYYVSGNFPGSTLLYGLFEWVSKGDVKVWRQLFVVGDLFLAISAFALLLHSKIRVPNFFDLATVSVFVLILPSLLAQGTVFSEDKQFQTASMMFVVALAVGARNENMSVQTALAIGIAFAFSIAFKVLGVALLPVVLCALFRRPPTVVAACLVGVAGVLTLAFLPFSSTYVSLMYSRFSVASAVNALPIHGSPWVLLHEYYVPSIRVTVCAVLALLSTWLFWSRRIDLLNWIASGLTIYICLWSVNGSINRLNMAMIFAAMCVWTISRTSWRLVIWTNIIAQIALYGQAAIAGKTIYALLSPPSDRIATCIFLVSYFAILTMAPKTGDWPGCRRTAAARMTE